MTDTPLDAYEHSNTLESSASEKTEQFDEHPELKNSMLYWFPRLRDAVAEFDSIETPDTLFVDAERINVHKVCAEADEPIPDAKVEAMAACPGRWDEHTVKRAADELGYPAFIRTDTDSAKHDMTAGSKIRTDDIDEVDSTVDSLIRAVATNGGLGARFNCLAVREWIDIAADFEAFGGTPIGPEVRVFVRDGTVECHHFYWPFATDDRALEHIDTIDNQQELTETLNSLEATVEEAMDATLRDAAIHISEHFDGYWSLDFALTTDGTWYAIDAARGDNSWHPEDCQHAETVTIASED